MSEYLADHQRVFDTGDHIDGTATFGASTSLCEGLQLAGSSYTQCQKSKFRLSTESGYRISQISIIAYGSYRPIAGARMVYFVDNAKSGK